MEKGYLDTLVSHVGAGLSKNRVAQQLKKLGLKRGVLTQTQVGHLDFALLPSLLAALTLLKVLRF